MDAVVNWGEKLVYSGTKDEGLPPKVLEALDLYLAESSSKLLVALPLKDDREEESKKPPRSVLMMECFEPGASTEQLMARLEVVGRHATSALYNSVEHKRIPLRFLWQPIAKVQEGLGGKTRAILYSIGAATVLLLGMLTLMPYPLKMDATGQLLPKDRQYLFAPVEGKIVRFAQELRPGSPASEGQPLVLLTSPELQMRMTSIMGAIAKAQAEVDANNLLLSVPNISAGDKSRIMSEMEQKKVEVAYKTKELNELRERINADPEQQGDFWLKSPLNGTVLNWGFKEQLTNSYVKPSQPLLRVGNERGQWEIELKIPQKHIGQIKKAFQDQKSNELDVDLLLASVPTETYRGKLHRDKIAGEAVPDKDDPNAAEPSVLATVRIDGADIPKDRQVPREFFTAGTEVHTKVRCGNHAMGYSLFYGLWEFFYENVVFFF
jgi:hypothetical protein